MNIWGMRKHLKGMKESLKYENGFEEPNLIKINRLERCITNCHSRIRELNKLRELKKKR